MRRPRTSTLASHVALALLALAFRAFVNEAENAGRVHERQDESHYVHVALQLLLGDWDVDYFINPPLYSLLLAACSAVWGLVQLALGTYGSWEEFAVAMAIDTGDVTRIGRGLSSAAGVGGVLALFEVGRRAYGWTAGFTAGAALAVDWMHARSAALAGNESLLVLLLVVAFGLASSFVARPGARKHAAMWIVFGLACATKYSAGLFALPLLAASWIARGREGWSPLAPRALAGLAAAPLAFLAGSPWVLAHPREFLHQFGAQSEFLHGGYLRAEAEDGALGYAYYALEFPAHNVGLAFSLICAAGIVHAFARVVRLRDARAALLLLAFVPAYLYLGSGVFFRMRFLLVAIPFVLLAGGALVGAMTRAAAPRAAQGAVLLLALATLGEPGLDNWRRLEFAYGTRDSRAPHVAWLEENVAPGERLMELTTCARPLLGDRDRLAELGLLDTPPTHAAARRRLEEHLATTLDLHQVGPLVQRSGSLDELEAALRANGVDRLVLVVTEPLYRDNYAKLPDFPRYAADPVFARCRYWPELLQWFARLPRSEEVLAPYGTQPAVMSVAELPR